MVNSTSSIVSENKPTPQEYIELADKTYLDTIKGGGYKDILTTMANFGGYSLRNQMLIKQQAPTATKVNTMNGWNYEKRFVVKGSKGIKILAPVFESIVASENGIVAVRQSDYVSEYKINFVFDISQTEQKKEAENTVGKNHPTHDTIILALKNLLRSFEIKEADLETDAQLDTRQKIILLKQGLTPEQMAKVLIEQTAAVLVLGRDRNKFQGIKADTIPNIFAIEISATAFVIKKQLGLETENLVVPEFDKMSDELIHKFANNLGIVRSISQLIIKAIDSTNVASKEDKTKQSTEEKLGALDVKKKRKIEAMSL